MNPARESTVTIKATPRVRSCVRRPRAIALVAMVGASLLALPHAAQASDWSPPGLGGAQIDVAPDGYDLGYMGSSPTPLGPFSDYRVSTITGRSFVATERAHIFQCPAGAQTPHLQCQLLAVANTDRSGNLPATDVELDNTYHSVVPAGPDPRGTYCFGPDVGGGLAPAVQCSVVVATVGPDLQPTSRAEHLICFSGMWIGPEKFDTKCKPRPTTSLLVEDVSVLEGNTGTTNANFKLTLSAPMSNPVTVNYATTDDTATAGSDYTATSGTLTIAAGTTTATISVPVTGDTSPEADERFFLGLSNPSDGTGLAHPRGAGTIFSDDAGSIPTMSVNDVQVTEGNAGTTTPAIFTVSLSKPSPAPVSVRVLTIGGTAHVHAGDFANVDEVITFAPGQTTRQVPVTVFGDNMEEPDESLFLQLEKAAGAIPEKRMGRAVIRSDDNTTISISDASVAEGASGTTTAMAFTVSLSDATYRTVSVDYVTADGNTRTTDHTTLGAADYTPVSGRLNFAPGESSKTVVVNVKGDNVSEPDEEFFVNLSNNTNSTLIKRAGLGTIRNDDGTPDAPQMSITDVRQNEGPDWSLNCDHYHPIFNPNSPPCPPTEFRFTVSLSKATSQPVSVNYLTTDGTARSTDHSTFGPADYTATSGSVSFAPGETTKTVVVLVKPDYRLEDDEDFFVQLRSAVNAVPTKPVGRGTILNDYPDGQPGY